MKKIIYTLMLLFVGLQASAQAPDYDDLKILYADGNYEKLVKVAFNYTEKEDLKKDPLPSLWLAKGLYKVSLSGTDDEKFKNAYKEAITALGKAMKLDKEGTILADHQEFIEKFQASMIELISNEITAADYNKASGWVVKYYKITRNPVGAKYMEGVTKFAKADKGGATTIWKEADALLAKTTSIDEWSEADRAMLQMGILETAKCYVKAKQKEKAKALIAKVSQWFEEDAEFKSKVEEILK
ncbi:MAG: hypothetical protein RL632_1848 [Bacteroidota bacterium]